MQLKYTGDYQTMSALVGLYVTPLVLVWFVVWLLSLKIKPLQPTEQAIQDHYFRLIQKYSLDRDSWPDRFDNFFER